MSAIKNLIKKVVFLFLSAEKKEVMRVLQDYSVAFMTFEPQNVLGYFERPMMFLSDNGPSVYKNSEEITTFLKNYMAHLQDEEYAKDDLSKFRIKTLTPNVVVTSFNLVRVNKAGNPFDKMGATYTWRKTNDSWKVVIGVLLSH